MMIMVYKDSAFFSKVLYVTVYHCWGSLIYVLYLWVSSILILFLIRILNVIIEDTIKGLIDFSVESQKHKLPWK